MRRVIINTAGLVALAAAAVVYLINPTFAADKAAPAEPPKVIDAQGNEKAIFSGCYGQVGGGSIFSDGNTTVKGFIAGAGCDWQTGKIVVGGLAKYGFYEDDARALTLGGRLGYTINPHTLLYVHGGVLMDGKSPKFSDSVVMGGLGVETVISHNMTVFFEAATDVQKWGDFRTAPTVYELNGGVRIRF